MVYVGCMNNTTSWVSFFLLATCLLFTQSTAADRDNSTSSTTTSVTTSTSVRSSNVRGPSTCPTGTVNYITQSLPQQCRKTGLTIKDGLIAREGVESAPIVGNALQSSQEVTDAQVNGTTLESIMATVETVKTGATSFVAETALPTPVEAEPDPEIDSPLDSVNFLSFEDWKKENLAKVGQSPEHLNQQRASSGELRRRPVNIHALESLGDEAEIDIDFSNFGSGTIPGDQQRQGSGSSGPPADADGSSQSLNTAKPFRSKDAGTTCKERFNYASFDCGATLLKTNPKCRNANAILLEAKDSYMINDCKTENKFVIVELCEDILIDTVVLARFEFFSAAFREFRISVSDRYPVKNDKWKSLGVFEAQNTREIQAFGIENPLIWARYIRIEFLTHFGKEHLCPVSLLRVHGTTMMEEYRHQEESTRGKDDLEESVQEMSLSNSVPEDKRIEAEAVAHPEQTLANPTKSIDEPIVTVNSAPSSRSDSTSISTSQTTPVTGSSASSIVPSSGAPGRPASDSALPHNFSLQNATNDNQTAVSNLTMPILDHAQDIAASNATASNSTASKAIGVNDSSSRLSQTVGTNESKLPMIATTPLSSAVSIMSSSQPPAPSPTTQDSFYKQISKRLQMLESNSTLSVKYIEEQSRILRDAFTKTEKRQSNRTEKFLHQVNATVVGELLRIGQQYDQLFQSIVIQSEAFEERHQRDIEVIMNRLGAMNDDLTWQKRVSVAQSSLLLFIFALIVFVRSGSNTLGLELPLMQQMLNKSQTVLRLPLDSDSPMQSPGSRTPSPVTTRYKTKARPPTRSSDDTDHDQDHDQSSMINGEDGPFARTPSSNPRLHFSPATPTELGSPSRWANGTPATDVDDVPNGIDGDESEDPAEDVTGEPQTPVIIRQTQSGPATPSGTRENHDPLEWESDDMSKLEVVHTLKGPRKMSPSSLRYVERVGDGEDPAKTSKESALEGD